MLTIDGSTLEAGGQLTRLSLCLAAITRQSIRIHSIRAGRSAGRSSKSRGQTQEQHRDVKGRDRYGNGYTKSKSNSKSKSTTRDGPSAPAAGLKDSHLAALNFLAEMVGATVEGGELGSSEVVFRPALRSPADTKTEHIIALTKPGSVWLIFQAIYPYLCFCTDWSCFTVDDELSNHKSHDGPRKDCISLRLRGGTNAPKAMTTEYMAQVFAPLAQRIGLPRLEVETIRAGWAGNAPEIGEVVVRIFPPVPSPTPPSSSTNNTTHKNQTYTPTLQLQPFTLSRHQGPKSITHITITVIADPDPTISSLQTKLSALLSTTFPSIPLDAKATPSGDPRRLYILLVAHSATSVLGCDYIGGGGRPKTVTEAERQLDDACRTVVTDLLREVNGRAAVDRHMVDQLVVFQALACGMSRVGSRVDGDGDGDGHVDEGKNERINENGAVSGHRQKSNLNDHKKTTGYTARTRNPVDVDRNDKDEEEHETVDTSGSLHARTVRWVCSEILGRFGNERGHQNKDGCSRGPEDMNQHAESNRTGIKFEQGGICHGIGWNASNV